VVARKKRKTALEKSYEANVARYKIEGLDGRPMNFENYHRGFYHPEFDRESKKNEVNNSNAPRKVVRKTSRKRNTK